MSRSRKIGESWEIIKKGTRYLQTKIAAGEYSFKRLDPYIDRNSRNGKARKVTTPKRLTKPEIKRLPNRVIDMSAHKFQKVNSKTWVLKKIS